VKLLLFYLLLRSLRLKIIGTLAFNPKPIAVFGLKRKGTSKNTIFINEFPRIIYEAKKKNFLCVSSVALCEIASSFV
jgi:hypothetical protein